MKMQDYKCKACGHELEILVRGRMSEDPRLAKCPSCQCVDPFSPVIKHAAKIIPDDVPGGFFIENLNPIPTWFPSKSAYQRELASRGLTTEKGNQWRGNPGEGSDKPANGLSRWVGISTESEEDRVKAWHEHEARLQSELSGTVAGTV